MDYDYSKMQGKIREVYGTQRSFADAMGIALVTLNLKLNNKSEWTQAEMESAMELLHIPRNKVKDYFFTHKV